MRLSYDLTLEQTQKLIMTPELRQAIELLQYTSLELNEYLNKELEENPLLEMERSNIETENIDINETEQEVDWSEYFENYDDISYKQEVDRNKKDFNIVSLVSYSPTLTEHLISQLNLMRISKNKCKLGEYIIHNIDENGYLNISLEEIASLTKTSIKEVERVLKIIQSFDPIGVGARSLKECLLLQIKKDDTSIVRDLIENHLEDIANNKIIKIAKEYNVSLEEVQSACDFIRTLEPKPGRLLNTNNSEVKYIIPDALIQYIDGEYIIIINDYTGPRLNINNFYRSLLKDGGDKATNEFIQEKLNSAMWIIRSIEQRRQTIYKVVESILKYQRDFFDKGVKYLQPLTLKDVAEDIDMHESTVSRTTNGKYVQTPRGLFELRYFFTSSLTSLEGDISSTGVKSMIKDIVENENPKKPYSDQQISNILKEKGTKISRRTVAKYRDELNIPSSSLRRRF